MEENNNILQKNISLVPRGVKAEDFKSLTHGAERLMKRLATVRMRRLLARGDTLEARDGAVADWTRSSPPLQALRAPCAQCDVAAGHEDNIDLASEANNARTVLRHVVCL